MNTVRYFKLNCSGSFVAQIVVQYMDGRQWKSWNPEGYQDILIHEERTVDLAYDNNVIPYILQITDKITSGPPHFYEMGHSQPSQLSQDYQTAIKEVACSAVKAIGLYNTLAHVEMKATKVELSLLN